MANSILDDLQTEILPKSENGFLTGNSLYQRILGDKFYELPEKLKALHSVPEKQRWNGSAEVRRGNGFLANLIADLIGFPPASDEIPVSVKFEPKDGGEVWERDFNGHRFSSFQFQETGARAHILFEKFGVITVAIRLNLKNDCLYLFPVKWWLLGIAMPSIFLPKGENFETESDGQFQFNVSVEVPFIGLLAAYKGRLEPDIKSS